jgi:hypothetical protein
MLSNSFGFQMGDVLRAIAVMSGAAPSAASACVGQVAAWLSPGDSDTVVTTREGELSRDFRVKAITVTHRRQPWIQARASHTPAATPTAQ